MHQLFYVHDVLLEIIDMLNYRNKYLFARTCKTIWLSALPQIWRSVFNPFVLKSLLPEDVYLVSDMNTTTLDPFKLRDLSTLIEERSAMGSTKKILSRELEEEEWSPLQLYGSHTHHLHLRDHDWYGSERISLIIMTCPSATPLFPNLSSLDVDLMSETGVVACTFFVSHRTFSRLKIAVHSLGRVSKHNPTPSQTEGLLRLVLSLKTLQELEFSVVTDWKASDQGFDDDWRHRQSLEIASSINPSGLWNLKSLALEGVVDDRIVLGATSSLPVLRTLSIDMPSLQNPSPSSPCLTAEAFPALQALNLQSDSWTHQPDYAWLLRNITSSSLGKFEFTCTVLPTDFIGVIGERWSATLFSLTLRLRAKPWILGKQLDLFLPFDVLRPLLTCHRLRHLIIESGDEYEPPGYDYEPTTEGYGRLLDFTDGDFDVMSSAWPDLRVLSLEGGSGSGHGHGAVPQATKRTLAFLALNCPALWFLRISIDLDSGDLSSIPQQPKSVSIEQLDVHLSACTKGNEDQAISFLHNTFPNIGAFACCNMGKYASQFDRFFEGMSSSIGRRDGMVGAVSTRSAANLSYRTALQKAYGI